MIIVSSIYPILCEVMNVLILKLCVIFVSVNTFRAVKDFITRNNKNKYIYIYII